MPGGDPVANGKTIPGNHAPHKLTTGPGREVLVGEMCPQGAGGRPGIAPIAMRSVGWSDNANDMVSMLERGSVPRFAVYGVDGKMAGVFDTLGIADVGMPTAVASGGYSGAPPCTYETAPTQQGSGSAATMSTRAEDPKCTPATFGCGLAVGQISRPDDPPETPTLKTGGACVAGDSLAVDIDGDGTVEVFPLSGVLDGIRGPANEWLAGPISGAGCKPQFQLFDIALGTEVEGSKDPRAAVAMDVLGVIDLDGDGKREVVLALRFATTRSVLVYSATESPQRLELAGEGTSFPR